MQLFLSFIFFFGSLFIAAPDLDVGKFHELAQGQSFQKDISVFRKEVRQRTQKTVARKDFLDSFLKASDILTRTEKVPAFLPRTLSPHLFQYRNPHTLPLPPPVIS